MFESAIGGALGALFLFGAYFLPSIVAARRKHRNSNAICAFNFFFGWTILGWIAAFIWSITDNVKS